MQKEEGFNKCNIKKNEKFDTNLYFQSGKQRKIIGK